MDNGIPLDEAELLSTILEGILYGFSLLMFGGTIWALLSRRSTGKVNRTMLTVASLLMTCSTAHLVVDIIRLMEGLVLYRDTYPGGPIAFFSDLSQWTFVSKNYLYGVQTLMRDAVILYRCYVVWQSKLVMVLPALLWCASLVSGIASPYAALQTTQPNASIFSGNLAQWITSFYATCFVSNLLATCLLVFRIWHIDQKVAKLRDGSSEYPLRKTLHIIIDAGVIYFLALLVALISFVCQSNSQFVVLDMVSYRSLLVFENDSPLKYSFDRIVPIVSITFYMIIVRVGLAHQTTQTVDILSLPRFAPIGDGRNSRLSRMRVCVTTLTENRVDGSLVDPATAIDNENCQTPSEIKFDDARDTIP